MIYNSILKIKENFSIDAIIKIFSILFICLIEFRIFHHKSLSLADPVFVLLFTSILVRDKKKLFNSLKYNAKLVILFLVFATIWVISYLSPVLSYDDLIAFF